MQAQCGKNPAQKMASAISRLPTLQFNPPQHWISLQISLQTRPRVTQLATLVREIGSTTETVVASRSISTSCQGKFPILEILAGLPPLKRPPAAPFPFGGRPHFRFAQVLPGSDQPRFLPNRPISTSQPEFPVCPSLPPPAVRIDNLDIQVSTNPWSRTCHSPTRHLRALGALPPIGDTRTRPLAHFSIASRPCRHRTPPDARM
jgi:hypothetical protein